MPYTALTYIQKDQIAYVTLNRPEEKNAINQRLAQEIEEVSGCIRQDDDIFVVVLTGAGGVFCAGAEPGLNEQFNSAIALASIPQPVIAAINGDAIGEGLELALSCDIRITSDKARFGMPQVAQGLLPINGGTQRLPRIVGRGKAMELLFTAAEISAKEALEIGLVNRVVPSEVLPSEVERLAREIAGKGPIALRFVKEAVNKGLDMTLEQGLHLEADLYFLLHPTADRTEGIRAFLEKRHPHFKGK